MRLSGEKWQTGHSLEAVLRASAALYPQCNWRAMLYNKKLKKEVPTDINGGTPTKAIARGMAAWKPLSGGKPINPMAGEIDLATADEIKEYGDNLKMLNVKKRISTWICPKFQATCLQQLKRYEWSRFQRLQPHAWIVIS